MIIIGAGITGLSTAASLKEKNPKLNILILEKGLLPTGASTKNAGFACFGSLTELLSDYQKMGKDSTLSLVEQRWKGLHLTRKRLGDQKIDIQMKSGYELFFEKDPEAFDHLDDINVELHSIFGRKVYRKAHEKIKGFGFRSIQGMIENVLEGQLDTGKLMHHLWQYCTSLRVDILTGAQVKAIDANNGDAKVYCQDLVFSSKYLTLCTNAFTSELIPIDLTPGRGIVLSIRPEQPLSFQGTFHYDEGFYYFRDYYERVLFGGGRNIDFESECTTDFTINTQVKSKLEQDLNCIILPDQEFEIEMTWTGIMAFGQTKNPTIRKVNECIFIGVGLGGMGVAVGSQVGEQLAKMILEGGDENQI